LSEFFVKKNRNFYLFHVSSCGSDFCVYVSTENCGEANLAMSANEEILESASRKRKFEDDEKEEENLSKRKLVAREPEIEEVHLLDLAEEILMEVLSKLDGESLHTLGS
jgi:hypothetical protein